MTGLIECVPNISEGRRPLVIDTLANVVRAIPGVRLLDRTSDADHNRSVLTFAGEATAVEEAALALVAAAYREIDMRVHVGVHPRIGAVDVVPFVPLAGASMEDCIELAHRFGRTVAERHGVPVYFYAKAALLPERVRLPNIRKPQYEGLASVLATTHVPDAGPGVLNPAAGAIVVGARPPLIAFNVELATTDLSVAKRIAAEIRESSGGLPAVQALGFALSAPDRTQVSINLLDYSITPLSRVWSEVVSRAAAAGIQVVGGELIGLVPLDAMTEVAGTALQIEGFTGARVIEGALFAVSSPPQPEDPLGL